jgi:hypothetical protein
MLLIESLLDQGWGVKFVVLVGGIVSSVLVDDLGDLSAFPFITAEAMA